MVTRYRIYPGDGDPRHGSENGYNNLGCRCPDCTAAHAAHCYDRHQERIARGLAPDDRRHGTENGYGNWGCRCEPCTAAWSAARHKDDVRRRDRAS